MVDFRLLNGSPKVTIIEKCDGKALVILRKNGEIQKMPFLTRQAALEFIQANGLEINVSHIAGPGGKEKHP